MKQSDDQTLFAWQVGYNSIDSEICGPLAISPSQFHGCRDLLPVFGGSGSVGDSSNPYSMTNKGLRIELLIVNREDQKHAIAILQCSTAASYPGRIELPLVRIAQQGSSHYARDARYLGPLATAHLDTVSKSRMETILMIQQPGKSVELNYGLIVRIQHRLEVEYAPIQFSPKIPRSWSERTSENVTCYRVPSNCRRGSILFAGRDGTHLMILYSIELQRVGQFSCKALYSPPRLNDRTFDDTHLSKQQLLIHSLVSELEDWTVSNGTQPTASWYYGEQQLSELHDSFINSNLRTSIVALPQGNTVHANIALETVNEKNTLVLDIEFQKQSEELRSPYELDAPLSGVVNSKPQEDSDAIPESADVVAHYKYLDPSSRSSSRR
jgi:hypothetical protein